MNERYYVAILPSEELSQLGLTYQQQCAKLFNTHATLRSPAHITLIPPFHANKEQITQLSNKLARLADSTAKLCLECVGWQHFTQKTIFLAFNSSKTLEHLYRSCNEFNQDLNNSTTKLKTFMPHLSIINRDLKPELYLLAWNYCNKLFYPKNTTWLKLVIFKYLNQRWSIFKSWQLGEEDAL